MYTNIRNKHTLAQYITSRMIRYIYNQSLHCVLKITIWLVFLMYSFGEMRFSGHSFRIKDFSRVQMCGGGAREHETCAPILKGPSSLHRFLYFEWRPHLRGCLSERTRESVGALLLSFIANKTQKNAPFLRHWSKNSNGPTASLNKGNKEIRDEIIKLNLQKTHKPRIGQDYDPLRTEIVIWWKKSARSWPKRR